MPYSLPRRRPRTLSVVLLATLVLALWTVSVYDYQVGTIVVLESGVWFPQYNVYYFVSTFVAGCLEHLAPIAGLFLLSFTAPFRRAFQDKAQRGDGLWLTLGFVGLELGFVLQQLWFVQLGSPRSSFGLLLVLAAGLTGGWRLGLQVGLLNMFALGGVEYAEQRKDPNFDISYLRLTLTYINLVVPVWAGALSGYLGEGLGRRRFNPLLALGLAVGAEAALIFFTLISTWVPPQMFARFLRNLVATPLLAGYALLVRYQLARLRSPLKMTQAELAVVEAELRALRAQIDPHFLLNALSVIHHLIRTQPERARELVLDLSDLFQHSLRSGRFVPLEQELGHVRAYLALEKARLTERLKVVWTVLAEDRLDTPIPTLCLQPLVENALKHGIAPQTEGGTLSIVIKQVHSDLVIQVDDNGVGFDAALAAPARSPDEKPPLGLSNIDRRLRLLYGPAYRLELTSTPGVGTTVVLRLPLPVDTLTVPIPNEAAEVPGTEILGTEVLGAEILGTEVPAAETSGEEVVDADFSR